MNTAITRKLPFYVLFLLLMSATSSVYAFEIQCPPDVTVDCDAELWDLNVYGTAKYHDYSGWHYAGAPWVDYYLNSCNTGYILRKWTVYNPYAHVYESCTQKITVEGYDIDGSFINWPKTGLELTGCNPNTNPYSLPPGYQYPTWNAPACSMIGVSYTDKIFYFGGACKKLVRTWEVLDCCNFNPYTGYGIWKFHQEIDITVSDIPQIICPYDITVQSTECNGTYVNVPGIEIPASECAENVQIMNDSPYAYSGGEDASGLYPLGTTIVTFTADFGCWQKTMCQVKVTVVDNSAPTPYCHYGLAIALMGIDNDGDGTNEEGMVEVWASDLDAGSYDLCNPGTLTFSFSSDKTDKSRVFTCEDVGRNDVEIWVTDQDGNQNYCNTYIKVQNNGANIPNCEDNDDFSTVSGTISAHYGDSVEDLVIKAKGTSHEYSIEEYTEEEIIEVVVDSVLSQSGIMLYIIEFHTIDVVKYDTTYTYKVEYTNVYNKDYFFEYLQHYHDYTIQGISIDADKSYLNKADVMAIQNYIDGFESFTAYQKMAADVNQDGFIDQADVNFLNDLVVHGNNWFLIDDTWHFFDKSMDMEKMDEDHECEEFCRINDLKENTFKVNLIGYRLGDVTNLEFSEQDGGFSGPGTEHSIKTRNQANTDIIVNPNPFSSAFTLRFETSFAVQTNLFIYNIAGELVHSNALQLTKGQQEIQINALQNLTSGVYHYSLQLGEDVHVGKLVKIN